LLFHCNNGYAKAPGDNKGVLHLKTEKKKNMKYSNNNRDLLLQGFEHLLENLGLGRLVFEKKHALSLHKINGSFQEVHDSLSLHQHSHNVTIRRKRQAPGSL
jgi:hypothetical protein